MTSYKLQAESLVSARFQPLQARRANPEKNPIVRRGLKEEVPCAVSERCRQRSDIECSRSPCPERAGVVARSFSNSNNFRSKVFIRKLLELEKDLATKELELEMKVKLALAEKGDQTPSGCDFSIGT